MVYFVRPSSAFHRTRSDNYFIIRGLSIHSFAPLGIVARIIHDFENVNLNIKSKGHLHLGILFNPCLIVLSLILTGMVERKRGGGSGVKYECWGGG